MIFNFVLLLIKLLFIKIVQFSQLSEILFLGIFYSGYFVLSNTSLLTRTLISAIWQAKIASWLKVFVEGLFLKGSNSLVFLKGECTNRFSQRGIISRLHRLYSHST